MRCLLETALTRASSFVYIKMGIGVKTDFLSKSGE